MQLNVLDQMNVVGREGGTPEATDRTLTMKEGKAGGLSIAGVRRVLSKRWGKRGIEKLEREGLLKIVETAADLRRNAWQ